MYLIIKQTKFRTYPPIHQVEHQTEDKELATNLASNLNAEATEKNESDVAFKIVEIVN